MSRKIIISKQFSLVARDWLKSLFYAIIVPVLLKVQELIDGEKLEFDWRLLGMVALSAGVAHILRKITEPSKVIEVNYLKDKKDPPPIGDPTHPKGFMSDDDTDDNDPPPIGDPTHPPKK